MELLLTTIATITAVAALFRPEWSKYFIKWFIKPKVDIYKTSYIEIGFTGSGSTIALRGTLLARNKKLLIPKMRCRVKRLSDDKSTEMDWIFIREDLISMTAQTKTFEQGENSRFRLPHAFYIDPDTTHPYSIIFSNEESKHKIELLTREVRVKWTELSQETINKFVSDHGVLQLDPQKLGMVLTASYLKFCESSEISEIKEELKKHLYWMSGEYHIELIVNSVNPDNEFNKKWGFKISDKDSMFFNGNVDWIIATVCNRPVGRCYFCFPRYESINVN